MTIKNYLLVQNNVVTDIVAWDGNTETWTPPEDAVLLVLSDTLSRTWILNADKTAYVLEDIVGWGSIGYTWDGTMVITNQLVPPAIDLSEITTTGTQTA